MRFLRATGSRRAARHRRHLALAGVALALGVAALATHAALPEHHHIDGHESLCLASLAVATLAVAGWALGRAARQRHLRPVSALTLCAPPPAPVLPAPRTFARAGPPGFAVLRR